MVRGVGVSRYSVLFLAREDRGGVSSKELGIIFHFSSFIRV